MYAYPRLPSEFVCGLGGFTLGAVALLLMHGAGTSAAVRPPQGGTNILAQAQPNTHGSAAQSQPG